MIHYHGLPILPATAAVCAVSGGHAFVSFRHPDQLTIALEVAQSLAVDNGAFFPSEKWRGGSIVSTIMDMVYANGAVQPRLFSEAP